MKYYKYIPYGKKHSTKRMSYSDIKNIWQKNNFVIILDGELKNHLAMWRENDKDGEPSMDFYVLKPDFVKKNMLYVQIGHGYDMWKIAGVPGSFQHFLREIIEIPSGLSM